ECAEDVRVALLVTTDGVGVLGEDAIDDGLERVTVRDLSKPFFGHDRLRRLARGEHLRKNHLRLRGGYGSCLEKLRELEYVLAAERTALELPRADLPEDVVDEERGSCLQESLLALRQPVEQGEQGRLLHQDARRFCGKLMLVTEASRFRREI